MCLSIGVSFFCLSSGSDSNCFYLGVDDCGILIDAGLGVRRTIQLLSDRSISTDNIKAIFITHDHIDHVRAVASLGERRGIPVYATEKTIAYINSRECIKPKLSSCVCYISKDENIKLGKFEVEAFSLPHDAADTVGYRVRVMDKTFVFMTDLGYIPTSVEQYVREATHLIIEANYDIKLLEDNPHYPESLKERIKSNYGHLSNQQVASYIANNISDITSHIWLCHLSQENNKPEIAYNFIAKAISNANRDVYLEVFKHGESSCIYRF